MSEGKEMATCYKVEIDGGEDWTPDLTPIPPTSYLLKSLLSNKHQVHKHLLNPYSALHTFFEITEGPNVGHRTRGERRTVNKWKDNPVQVLIDAQLCGANQGTTGRRSESWP